MSQAYIPTSAHLVGSVGLDTAHHGANAQGEFIEPHGRGRLALG